jgi:hypothetical protein
MRRAVLATAAGGLLVGPTVLAFYKGGYFDAPRYVAGTIAWLLVLVVAFASPQPLPSSWPGRAMLAGLAGITAWTAVSFAWAPLAAAALDNLTRLLLYLGVTIAAIAVLRDRLVARALEPVLAAGSLVVIGYGLAGRLLPGVLVLPHSSRGSGRLEQPITYWNAEGALAAMGLVLCARVAGDRSRPAWMRSLAAAGTAPLGLGVYLSYSRGAIAAGVVGLIVLVAAARTRPQLRAAAIALAASVAVALCSTGYPGVASLEGTHAQRVSDGATVLAFLISVMLAAGLLQAWVAAVEGRRRLVVGTLPSARRLPAIAIVLLGVAFFGLVGSGFAERNGAERRSDVRGVGRLTAVDSSRYDYWRVGANAILDHPLRGTGSGGFRVVWLRERHVDDFVLEVHSLPLEIAVELGAVGVLFFLLFIGGIAAAARRALRSAPQLAAGPAAAFTVWILHATIDWDWQLPAVSLVALLSAAAVVACSEARVDAPPPEEAAVDEESEPHPAPAVASI